MVVQLVLSQSNYRFKLRAFQESWDSLFAFVSRMVILVFYRKMSWLLIENANKFSTGVHRQRFLLEIIVGVKSSIRFQLSCTQGFCWVWGMVGFESVTLKKFTNNWKKKQIFAKIALQKRFFLELTGQVLSTP